MYAVRSFRTVGGVDYRSVGLIWGLMLGGELAVLQAPMFDGLSFDPGALVEDGEAAAEVDVGRGQVVRGIDSLQQTGQFRLNRSE